MKTRTIILMLLFASCSMLEKKDQMKAVEKAEIKWMEERIPIYKALNIIAGAKGKVEWETYRSEDYKSPDIFVAEGHAFKGDFSQFNITLLVNSSTGECELIGSEKEKFDKILELKTEMAKSSILY